MSIVLEDGSGILNANSYVTEEEFDTYCDDRDITADDGDAEAALIRAAVALDGKYRMKYPGYRTVGRLQGLEWPRTAAYDYEGLTIDTDEIPLEIKNAQCELALRELTEPGSLTPDLERGGNIRSIRAGSVGIDYSGSTVMTVYTIVDQILSKLIGPVYSPYSGKTVRG
jgi:hypothetical protein